MKIDYPEHGFVVVVVVALVVHRVCGSGDSVDSLVRADRFANQKLDVLVLVVLVITSATAHRLQLLKRKMMMMMVVV
mgnify:CR=1 FL=1